MPVLELPAGARRGRGRGQRVAEETALQALRLAPGAEIEMVRVPAGEFIMGSADDEVEAGDHERPQHRVWLPEYCIGKHEVTVAQFRAFAQATGYRTAAEQEGNSWAWTGGEWGYGDVQGADWQHPRGPATGTGCRDDHPVTHVTWSDALASAIGPAG